MAKFYKKTSQRILNSFKKGIVTAFKTDTPISGYKERRFQELFAELYGKGNYKIENKTNVYIRNAGLSWIHLCKIQITPTHPKEGITIKEIAETHAMEYIPTEINGDVSGSSFRESQFYTPQLFSVPPVGLDWEIAKEECDWTISDYEHKKTGAQFHSKTAAHK